MIDMANTVKTWDEFQRGIGDKLKSYPLIKPTKSTLKLAKKLFKDGHSINDAIGLIILNSKP